MLTEQQDYLIHAIAGSLKKVPKDIQERMLKHFYKADEMYGKGVEKNWKSKRGESWKKNVNF